MSDLVTGNGDAPPPAVLGKLEVTITADGVVEAVWSLAEGQSGLGYQMLGIAGEYLHRFRFRETPLEGQTRLFKPRR